jgi:Tfp pilus assembly protein PilO
MKNHARGMVLFSLLVISATIYFGIIPAEEKISTANANAEALLRHAITDEHALEDEPRILLLAGRIRENLKGLRIRSSDNADAGQALLGDVQTIAFHRHLIVTALKPSPTIITPPDGQKPVDPLTDPRRSRDVDVAVRGSYSDVLFFLRDISRMPTLARVITVQLDRENDDTNVSSVLEATTHIQTISLDRSLIP